MSPELISIIAILVASLSALYSRYAYKEAQKSNNLSRLNSLLSFRKHYLELIEHQYKLAETLPSGSKGMQMTIDSCANLDSKLREISKEIELYHNKVVTNKI